jgi:hypothetical protein
VSSVFAKLGIVESPDRHPGVVQGAGDLGCAVPGQPLGEHPRDDRRRGWVGFEAVRTPAPRGVRLVRVRARITEPVPVGRTPARYRPCSLVWAASAVRTRILVRVISRLDDRPSASMVCS